VKKTAYNHRPFAGFRHQGPAPASSQPESSACPASQWADDPVARQRPRPGSTPTAGYLLFTESATAAARRPFLPQAVGPARVRKTAGSPRTGVSGTTPIHLRTSGRARYPSSCWSGVATRERPAACSKAHRRRRIDGRGLIRSTDAAAAGVRGIANLVRDDDTSTLNDPQGLHWLNSRSLPHTARMGLRTKRQERDRSRKRSTAAQPPFACDRR